MRSTCIYCGNVITKASKEHVIQNALGGLLKSDDICCGNCNNLISKLIDVPFVSTFNGILDCVPDMVKTNKKNSKPSCTGLAVLNGETYEVVIKDRKVVACSEYSKKNKKSITDEHFVIVGYDFKVDNSSFSNGICKIALNYALSKGIEFEKMAKGVKITKHDDGITRIDFDYFTIPFIPLNMYDDYLELHADFLLFHHLILFSQMNKLWCYVNLFNTFQSYVLLCDSWSSTCTVNESYIQEIEKIDRSIVDPYIRKPKDILVLSDIYGLEPDLDVVKFKQRINERIRAESVVKETDQIYGINNFTSFLKYCAECNNNDISCLRDTIDSIINCILFYYDFSENEDDPDDTIVSLKEDRFRTVTVINEAEMVSYPEMIRQIAYDKKRIQDYKMSKFNILNSYLVRHTKNSGR